MFRYALGLIVSVFFLSSISIAFVLDGSDEKDAELKANARELLRETSSMALALNSPTNRINFTVKSADILWDMDEQEARGMFSASLEDIKRLMTQIDIDENRRKQTPSRNRFGRSNRGSRNATGKVTSLRSSLINALANHDPEWAMRLLDETSQIFTNPTLIKRIERSDKRLEAQIIRKIAAKDVTKALELAREKLSKGISSEVVSLLSQIYGKDKEKGAEFAEDVLSKLKSTTLKRNQTWIVVQLFQYGLSRMDSEENPLFDRSAMSDLGDLIANQITDSTSRYRSLPSSVMKGLEQHSPSNASRIKRTFEQRNVSRNGRSRGVDRNYDEKSVQKRAEFQSQLGEGLNRLGEEGLSSDDKKKILNDAKDKILSVEDESYRFNNLISLGMQAANVGEKETAISILDNAESLISIDPKERRDFSRNRSLANAYAVVDVNKSFNILETMVYRLNEVINGYIKFMEYSGNGRVVENSELLMNRRSRQFTNYLNFSPNSLRSLADEDYVRLKELTDKFERPEVRIEARLLIAKGLISLSSNGKNGDSEKKKISKN